MSCQHKSLLLTENLKTYREHFAIWCVLFAFLERFSIMFLQNNILKIFTSHLHFVQNSRIVEEEFQRDQSDWHCVVYVLSIIK